MVDEDSRDREDVLIAFAAACRAPRPADVKRWTKRYPHFACDIQALAVALVGVEGQTFEKWEQGAPPTAETPPMKRFSVKKLTHTDRRALHVRLNTTEENKETFPQGPSLENVVLWYGSDLVLLAEHLSIDVSVVTRATYRGIEGPIGRRLIEAMATALERSPEEILAAVELGGPRHAIVGGPFEPISYRSAIEATDMSSDQKAFWLADEPLPAPSEIGNRS